MALESSNISIGDVKKFVSESFSFWIEVLKKSVDVLRRRFLLFILILLVYIGYGVYQYINQTPFYTVSMACTYNQLHHKTYGEMIGKLNLLVQDGSVNSVAKYLGISPKVASSIMEVSAKNISGSKLEEDIVPSKLPFYIDVKLKNTDSIEAIQNGLVSYLLSSPKLAELKALNEERMKNRLVFLNQEIGAIDSVIKAVSSVSNQRGGTINNVQIPSMDGLFKQLDTLDEQKLDIEWGLKQQKFIEVIHGFMPSEHASKSGLMSVLYPKILAAILTSILVFFILEIIPLVSKKTV